jgi:hypothetical protein
MTLKDLAMDWNRMQEGLAGIDDVFKRFKTRLHDYLQTLEKEKL